MLCVCGHMKQEDHATELPHACRECPCTRFQEDKDYPAFRSLEESVRVGDTKVDVLWRKYKELWEENRRLRRQMRGPKEKQMDPDEALKNAREALQVFRAWHGRKEGINEASAEQLADAFEALDGWLSKGGFLPADWNTMERE